MTESHPWYALLALLAACGAVMGVLLASLPLPEALLVLTLAVTVVTSLLEPLAGLGVALLIGPLWAWLIVFPYVPPLIGQYLFLLVVAIWLVRGAAHREIAFPIHALLPPLLLFMGAALLSLWNPVDTRYGFNEFGKWGQIALISVLVYERIRGEAGARRVPLAVGGLALAAVFQAGLGIYQFALRGTGPAPFAIGEGLYRAYGTFQQPNPFAGFLGMVGAVLVGLALSEGGAWLWRWWRERAWPARAAGLRLGAVMLAAFLVSGAVGASWSRGAWVGYAAALLGMAALLPRRGWWGVLLVGALVLTGAFLYQGGWLPGGIAARLMGFAEYFRFRDVRGVGINDANYAAIERMAHWQAAIEMWRANFWFGVGLGGYPPAYPAYRLINWPLDLGHAHNYYLNLLAEVGLLGFLAYAFLMGRALWLTVSATRRRDGWARGLALGLTGAWIHLAMHSLVDTLLVNNVHLHIGVLLALSAWVGDAHGEYFKTQAKCVGVIKRGA